LKVTTQPLENCEIEMTVELDQPQADQLLQKAARRLSQKVKIPGFRPGKAPSNTVVRYLGLDMVKQEILEDLTGSVYKEAIQEADLTPFGPGTLEDVEWEPLTFKVRLPIAPQVELGDYRAIRLEQPQVTVDEAEAEKHLEALQIRHTMWKPVERPAQLGDRVTVNLVGKVGAKLVIYEDEASLLLQEGQPYYIDEVIPFLVGMIAGQEKDFVLIYSDHPDKGELAGQEVQFHAHLLQVEEGTLLPLDDDFARLVGDFDTLEDLRASVRKQLADQAQAEVDEHLADEALDMLVEKAERIAYPLTLLEEEIDALLEEWDNRLKQDNFSLDAYLQIEKKTKDWFRAELQPVAEKRLRRRLVLNEVANLEKLTVSEEEITQWVSWQVSAAGKQRQELLDKLMTPEGLRMVASAVLAQKARERLVAIVKGEASPLEEDMLAAESSAAIEIAGQEPRSESTPGLNHELVQDTNDDRKE
jgi:trigger factor